MNFCVRRKNLLPTGRQNTHTNTLRCGFALLATTQSPEAFTEYRKFNNPRPHAGLFISNKPQFIIHMRLLYPENQQCS